MGLATIVVLIGIAAIIALAIAIYRDITLINGADWPAVFVRLVMMSVIVLLSCAALKQRTAS
jgi:hypothetical protein